MPKCREQLLCTRRKLCPDLPRCSLAVTEGLLHSHLWLQLWQRRAVPAAGWHPLPSPLSTLQQRHCGPSALLQSQYLSLHCGTQTGCSVPQPFGPGCCSRAVAWLPRQPRGCFSFLSISHVPWAALLIGVFLHSS